MIFYSNFTPKSKKEQIISSALYIIFGILFMIIPGIIAKSFATFVGVALVAFGIYKLIFAFSYHVGYGYLSSILLLIFGFVIMFNHEGFLSMLQVLIGISVTMMGINKLMYSFMLKGTYKYWYLNTIIGAVILIMGFLIAFNPFESMNILIFIIGAALAIYGITKLISALNKKEEIDEEQMHQFFENVTSHTKKHNNDDAIDADFEEKK